MTANIIILAILGLVIFFAARSLYKRHKSGKSQCSGNCSNCGGCH